MSQVTPVTNEGNTLFPIFLKLRQLHTLIIGAGNVGEEKLGALLKNDPLARVTVVGTLVRPILREKAAEGPHVTVEERAFAPEDLEGKDVVVCATDNRKLHEEIREMARARNQLINVADTPDLCDFYLGSTVKKGDLKVGISTNGKSPTFAKRFRELLETSLPEDLDSLLNQLSAFRDTLTGDFADKVNQLNAVTAALVSGSEEQATKAPVETTPTPADHDS